jgi:hypothetical protein
VKGDVKADIVLFFFFFLFFFRPLGYEHSVNMFGICGCGNDYAYFRWTFSEAIMFQDVGSVFLKCLPDLGKIVGLVITTRSESSVSRTLNHETIAQQQRTLNHETIAQQRGYARSRVRSSSSQVPKTCTARVACAEQGNEFWKCVRVCVCVSVCVCVCARAMTASPCCGCPCCVHDRPTKLCLRLCASKLTLILCLSHLNPTF